MYPMIADMAIRSLSFLQIRMISNVVCWDLQHRCLKSRRDGIIVAKKMPLSEQNPIGVADWFAILMSPFQGCNPGLCPAFL